MAQRKPPPNYLAQRFQLRMLSLVAALAMVLVVMSMARNPDNWQWFAHFDQAENEEKEQLDTRFQRPASEQPVIYGQKTAQPSILALDQDVSLEEATWQVAIDQLGKTGREKLESVLLAVHHGKPHALDSEEVERLLSDLDRIWTVVSTNGQEPSKAETEKLEQNWTAMRQALARVLTSEHPDPSDAKVLSKLDQLLDQIAFRRIRDNTAHRKVEAFAWWRLLSRLRETPSSDLKQRSRGTVSFVQLFKQPGVYRCRLVTIQGRVRRVERIVSTNPKLGIDALFRLWVKPDDGTASPIVVYCLDLPPDFPRPTAEDPVANPESPGLQVSVDGYFFKRWHYSAGKGSAFLAPLVLARSPTWTPPPPPPNQTTGIDFQVLILSAIFAALIAASVTWYAWRGRHEKPDTPAIAHLKAFREARSSHFKGGDETEGGLATELFPDDDPAQDSNS